MNKAEYKGKLAATKVTETSTPKERKKAKQAENALRKFWKTAALAYIKKACRRDLRKVGDCAYLELSYDLSLTGEVEVQLMDSNPNTTNFRNSLEHYVIPKRKLLKS